MPALSGSDKAYKQARAGIERAGASRAGYFTPNVVLTINGSAVAGELYESLSVRLALNDEPDTASFLLKPGTAAPTSGQSVVVGLGTAVNAEFAGQITSLEFERVAGFDNPWIRVECTDWNKLFSRDRITEDFSGQSATDIARAIVATYTTGFFDYAIEPGLATIAEFLCVNETPMRALVRLANILGGGAYVDALKIVHLWDSAGPSSAYRPSPPTTITNSLSTLKAFTSTSDYSQVRTLVVVEGWETKSLVTIPVGADLATYGIPLNEDWVRFNLSPDADANYARIGTDVVSYDHVAHLQKAALLNVDAIAGDVEIEVVHVGGLSMVLGDSWLTDGNGHYFYFASRDTPGGGVWTLEGIPASGYGSIPLDMDAGTVLYEVASLRGVTADITTELPAGSAIVIRAQKADAAAQATIAAIEGGDGVHTHVVLDGRLSVAGCAERAQAELDTFSAALVRASWTTYDMNARPGAQQAISISGIGSLSTTLTVESVALDFPIPGHPPRRVCEGSTVKVAGAIEALLGQ